MKSFARFTTLGTKPIFVVLATTLPFTYKVARPDGVTVTLKYCHVLSWITFGAVSSIMLLPLATKNVRSFVR